MTITTILAAERDRYVSFFNQAAAKAKANNPEAVSELLISVNNEAIPYPYRYIRADIVEQRADGGTGVLEIRLDALPDFEATGFRLGSVTVEIYPFVWNDAQIAFDQPLADPTRLEQLLTHWLKLDETSDGEEKAIHSATQIETNGQLWFLTIDFGTAPVEAFVEILELLMDEGMTRLIVLSHPE